MQLTGPNIVHLLLLLAFFLLFARGLGEIFRLMRQPVIIGEITAGILLGPAIFGYFFPGAHAALFSSQPSVSAAMDGITQVGLIFLLLVSGIEVDLTTIFRQGKVALLTSVFSFLVPFSVGFFAGYWFPASLGSTGQSGNITFALFVGIALSITALPVVARTLLDLGIFKSMPGQAIIASAMLIDFIGWLVFSLIISSVSRAQSSFSFSQTASIAFGFVVVTLVVGRKLIHKALPFVQSKLSFPGGVLNFIIILGLFAAAFTEYLGIHAIFGAFIMGMAIGDSAHLREETRELIQQFVTNIFAPLFFISIGMKANFLTHLNPALVGVFILLAFLTKIFGSALGARLGGLNKEDAMIVGFGMNSRGAMEIILGLVALQYGLINEEIFVALVIMALVTSLSSAPFMNYFIRRSPTFLRPSLLLNQSGVLHSSESSPEGIIRELARAAAHHCKLPYEHIAAAVLKREEEFPTGIANGVAIPHARLKIPQPVLCAAIARGGINFSAPDTLPARLIFLLLTPENEQEMQLELLAGIARLAQDKERVEIICGTTSRHTSYQKIASAFRLFE